MSPRRIWCKSNNSVKTICNEILSLSLIHILSLFLVPAGFIKSLASIFIPKLVIDSLESFRSEYTFLINIIIVTVVIAVSSIVELLVKNTMEHNMNSFVLIQLNKLWIEKVATMDYEVLDVYKRQIYIRGKDKKYQKIKLKSSSIKRYNAKFKLKCNNKKAVYYFKVRTIVKRVKKKYYSVYSDLSLIHI